MKKKVLSFVVVTCLLFLSIMLSSCTNVTKYESRVVEMFENNAVKNDDGCFSFRKYNNLNNANFTYEFIYDPNTKQFCCNVLVVQSTNLYEYASAIFVWGKFKEASFYGYHKLGNVAKIEFKFSNLEFKKQSILGDCFTYDVISNTFLNLKNKNDIDEYATTNFNTLQQAVSYAKSVLVDYNISTELW